MVQSTTQAIPSRTNLGVVDMFAALGAPRRAFEQVEDVARYGWPLVILLTAVALIGYGTVQTGLIDREVERRVQERIAVIDSTQRDIVERSTLRELYENERKLGEFNRVVLRIGAVAAGPLGMLAQLLIIAAVLFGAVALTGRKAEWHTLLTLTVYAGLIDVIDHLVRFVFMLRFATLDVDTSLGLVVRHALIDTALSPQQVGALAGLATMIAPFRIWYWVVLIIGLDATRQLRGWRAWVLCGGCWLVGGLVRAGLGASGA